jgi:poly(beta-D-mannuronate) lyase
VLHLGFSASDAFAARRYEVSAHRRAPPSTIGNTVTCLPLHTKRGRAFALVTALTAAFVSTCGAVATSQAADAAAAPSSVLDLRNWKLTLPVASPGTTTARDVAQPELTGFALSPWFFTSGSAVTFRANAGGATTGHSSYPRSELREMSSDGTRPASWATTSGVHTLTVREAVTHLPVVKPQVVIAQIHDASDDVIEVLADGKRVRSPGTYAICVRLNGVELDTCLTDAYTPGSFFTLQIVAAGGRVKVLFNQVAKLNLGAAATGCYFKAGAYTQSNPTKGDSPSAYGEVRISRVTVGHSV